MKLNHIISVFIVAAVLFSGCKKDWLDVNEDPETTSSADPEFLLYNAQTSYSANRTSEIGLSGAMWSQLWASGASASVFRNPERYIFSIFTTGNTWRSHYTDIQKNLRFAIDLALSSDPAKPNMAAQARTLRALTFYTTSVLWEKAPYSEAINPDISQPRFDSQEEIMNGILAELDQAIAEFDPSDPNVAGDHYFEGDVNKWIAFAKSLKFRILMLMLDADPSKEADVQSMLADGGMITTGGDANFPFLNKSGSYNPNWNVLNTFAGGQNLFYFASQVTVDLMKKYNDPRLTIYFDPGFDTTGIKGVYPGDPGDYDKDSRLSLNVIRPDAPERVFTYTEQLFLEAEAEFRVGSMVNADQKLHDAISNSMTYWGVDGADINNYLLMEIPPLATLSESAALQLIAEQFWIALIDKPIEAWTMWRRLEFPELLLPNGAALGSFVRRLPYPPDELTSNSNAPSNPSLDTKMWFDQ